MFVEYDGYYWYSNMQQQRIILGIDPGLAHTGWGVIEQAGSKLACLAYGCVETKTNDALPARLKKIQDQIAAVVERYRPSAIGIESVWFGENTSSAFATGQARGAALVACAGLELAEFTPRQIKLAVVGTGTAEKDQVAYMVQQLLGLEAAPTPDHAADALAAAICFTTQNALSQLGQRHPVPVSKGDGVKMRQSGKNPSTPISQVGRVVESCWKEAHDRIY